MVFSHLGTFGDVSVTESKLTLLAARQANESERRGVETRDFIREEADREDGRLVPQNNPLVRV